MAGRKRKPEEHDIETLISDAETETETLNEEMSNWRDNMEERMSHLPKFDEVSEAADSLDSAYSTITDAHESFNALPEDVKKAKATIVPGRMPRSRADRASEAASGLRASADRLHDLADEREKTDSETAFQIEEVADALETAAEELENIMFPGMY